MNNTPVNPFSFLANINTIDDIIPANAHILNELANGNISLEDAVMCGEIMERSAKFFENSLYAEITKQLDEMRLLYQEIVAKNKD